MENTTTWQQLKDFCNSLDETQLGMALTVGLADQAAKSVIHLSISGDDYLINPDDIDDQGYRSAFISGQYILPGEENDFDESNYVVVIHKGTPIFVAE